MRTDAETAVLPQPPAFQAGCPFPFHLHSQSSLLRPTNLELPAASFSVAFAARNACASPQQQPLLTMLARGALCRLAADVPKTHTHDLPRLAHLLRAGLFSRQGASRAATGAIARAFNAAVLESRRAYATKTETESTDKVKKDVKKAAAKKPAAAKKSTSAAKAKPKPQKKVAAKKKAAPKKKKVAAPKKAKKPKKVLTPEEKETQVVKALKQRALKPPPAPQSTAWSVFVLEHLRSTKLESVEDGRQAFRDASVLFKKLTPAEKEVC